MSQGYVLDSHVFLWLASGEKQLPRLVVETLRQARDVFVSPVSVAELCIKSAQKKLLLPAKIAANPAAGFRAQAAAMDMAILPLDVEAAAALQTLPLHHRDPFDRLLIAQALVADLIMVTHDRALAAYEGLEILWT